MEGKFEADKVCSIHNLKGETFKEKIKNCYKIIGQYFINHAEELSADIEPNISEIKLNIEIPNNYAVTLEKKINYYVLNEEKELE